MKKLKIEDLKIKSFSINEDSKEEFGGVGTAGYGTCYSDFDAACYGGGGWGGGGGGGYPGYYNTGGPNTGPVNSTSVPSSCGAFPGYNITRNNYTRCSPGAPPAANPPIGQEGGGVSITSVEIGGDCRTSPNSGSECTHMGRYPNC